MAKIEETVLPGMGIRYAFLTEAGKRVGVLHHRTGRRELLLYDRDDPDMCAEVLALEDDDARTLIEVLGGSRVAEQLSTIQRIEGLAIDWLPLRDDTPYAGRTIGDTAARTRTGTSIVAVVRGADAHPAPGPDFGLEAGDTLVVVGTPRGIEDLSVLLRTG
ncbi:MAG TPA: cation:proton antiporter regulatory subunit [Actinomycetota bacterium]|nr:cation:proton antiporter regulatory subunit [Actinomycetota bacterium]